MRLNRNQFEVGIQERTPDGDYVGTLTGEDMAPIPFRGTAALLTELEDILRARNYPQSATNARVFREIKTKRQEGIAVNKEIQQQPTEKPGKATFVVTVLYRQNATWQGTVKWLEGKQEQKFRSALELIKLMDNAAEQTIE